MHIAAGVAPGIFERQEKSLTTVQGLLDRSHILPALIAVTSFAEDCRQRIFNTTIFTKCRTPCPTP
jgi:hypothetical protein